MRIVEDMSECRECGPAGVDWPSARPTNTHSKCYVNSEGESSFIYAHRTNLHWIIPHDNNMLYFSRHSLSIFFTEKELISCSFEICTSFAMNNYHNDNTLSLKNNSVQNFHLIWSHATLNAEKFSLLRCWLTYVNN